MNREAVLRVASVLDRLITRTTMELTPTEAQSLAEQLRTAVAAAPEPVAYMRFVNGKPDWDENCVSDDPSTFEIFNYDPEEHYEVVPLYR